MRLLLVRHAQSEANAVGSLDCTIPGPGLTAFGHSQAAELAVRMRDADVRAVYASRMTRAQQTAAPLAAQLGQRVVILDGIHEVFLGDLNDRVDDEAHSLLDELFAAWMLDGQLERSRPRGETGTAAERRIRADLDILRSRHGDTGGAVVLVAHGMSLRIGATHWADGVGKDFAFRHHLPNTGIVEIDVPPPGDHRRPRVVDWAGLTPVL